MAAPKLYEDIDTMHMVFLDWRSQNQCLDSTPKQEGSTKNLTNSSFQLLSYTGKGSWCSTYIILFLTLYVYVVWFERGLGGGAQKVKRLKGMACAPGAPLVSLPMLVVDMS